MKEKALEFLNKDYLLNVDMIECIRRDICRILYASDKAVLIVADSGWVHMLSCEDRELGLELIKTHQPPWVVLHQMDMREAVAGLGYRIGDECWQSAYTKTTPMEETLAIGDNYNDLPMLRAAGLGVCVANGLADVKAEADVITASDNNNSAVAEVLDNYVL